MAPAALAPWLSPPSLVPNLPPSPSSELQEETAEECLPFLLGRQHLDLGTDGLPPLSRPAHARFLQGSLARLPAGFAALDASRPWMLYWALNGLAFLDPGLPASYRDSLVRTLAPLQNLAGGFGGSHGQYSHLATSYAAVLALLTVGGQPALDLIDRPAMWRWLGMLKQPAGDFQMSIGGERDVRGAYCAMTIIALLNLSNRLPQSSPAFRAGHETFESGLGEHIAKCQTYEGGIGSVPDAEAHGAYTFCALACLCIIGEPAETMRKYLDLASLVSWLASRQHAPEGGFAGRSNKLVDGCYSHWLGGCWSLVEAALGTSTPVWNRHGLEKYILCCCQGQRGGLRDKPSKSVDAYHSCYNLAGLSSTQHYYSYEKPQAAQAEKPLDAAFRWRCVDGQGSDNKAVSTMHPVFVIPVEAVEAARQHFGDAGLPSIERLRLSDG